MQNVSCVILAKFLCYRLLLGEVHFKPKLKSVICVNVTARPPAMENQEADTSSQAIKRRLPREIKLKLAKVARLAVMGKLL